MKKIYLKLIAITLTLMLSASIVVMSSYAWLVLSKSPAAEGIQITIAGGNTILVAPDMSEAGTDGAVYHYPGSFSDTLNFVQHSSYSYLNAVEGMTPVSTADGVNWFIPTYYDLTDPEVKSGAILTGTMKDVDEFEIDTSLKYANLSAENAAMAEDGSYIYLDFWVVSPGMNYTLRVSTGEDSNGSFAIALPTAKDDGTGKYTLSAGAEDAAASVRVGFLVNPDPMTDGSVEAYGKSHYSNEMYTGLRGAYTEPGGAQVSSENYRFTIYEPNGDSHPGGGATEGNYVITEPLLLFNGVVLYADISRQLTVQLKNHWVQAGDGSGQTQIEQRFQTYIAPGLNGKTLGEASSDFYREYLDGLVAPYVWNGAFVKNTSSLYGSAGKTLQNLETVSEEAEEAEAEETAAEAVIIPENEVSAEFLTSGFTAGATDDVYIVDLEENIPQRIRMFIWLEGQDVDCVKGVSSSELAISIELAGSNQDIA